MNPSAPIKISVLTPSIRPEGLKLNQISLEKQTFQDFEWLTEIGIPGKGHDLNQSYNRMLKRAKGQLIVSMQDWVIAPPWYLEKFWVAHCASPDTFFTAPVGKVDNIDGSGEVRWDWRAWTNGEPKDILPSRWDTWEIDSACAPKEALFKVGGFDEELDQYWSCDNVNVGCRAELAGYKFANLFNNPVKVWDHDKFVPHPHRSKYNSSFNNDRMTLFRSGWTINYLSDEYPQLNPPTI